MKDLKTILLEEIAQFRELGHKFLKKEVTSMDFKKVSGGMGVYAHRGGTEFMARLRIPSGVITSEDFKIIYNFATANKLSNVHLTTRQSIQLHGLSIDEICAVMEEGLEKNIYTRGAGGNYPRNVSMSPLSGVDPEEAFDVTPYAMKVNQHFINKIYTYKLPRKMKVAFSSGEADHAHCTATDLGFLAVKKNDKEFFRLFLGGGIGINPALSLEFDELVEPKDILYHVEAITNLFMKEGDYENKGKARIRYIVKRLGQDAFIKCYKKYLEDEKKKNNLEISIVHEERHKTGVETNLRHARLFNQKQEGLYSIYFHPIGGKLTLDTMKLIIDELDKTNGSEIRLTMTEGLYIRNLDGREAESWLKLTDNLGGETKLEQSVSCIGVPICQIGILNSQNTLEEIINMFRLKDFKRDVLPRVRISGCPNSCSLHQIGEIGLTGKMKKVNGESRNIFELHIDGDYSVDKARLARSYGDLPQEKIPEFLYELAQLIQVSHETFSQWINNNEKSFKELVGEYSI
ncbi:MAG: nitrite/sulfite reductase [Clostridiaceae bacterium]|nr:nitrite/sulfite reductase [Clostridiaceae bacterium]